MADTKISALTASTTPLAGTEVLPIVQGGVTKQVSVANLTAGRAISASQLTLTGNLIVASGQGIDFSATPGTGTSELLNDYEEGNWTPVVSKQTGGAVSGTINTFGRYVKVGSLVTVFCEIDIVSISAQGTGFAIVSGLPFTPARSYIGNGAIGLNSAFLAAVMASCYALTSNNVFFHETLNTDANSAASWKVGVLTFTVSYYV